MITKTDSRRTLLLRGDGRLLRTLGVVTFIAFLGSLTGCGDGRPATVSAAGQVLLDGQPLTTGAIRVIPKQGRAASGMIGSDGRFTLGTYEDNDGCLPGTHAVEIVAQKITGDEESEDAVIEWIAPARYANQATSGLTLTVSGPTDSLLIELTTEVR